MQPRILSQSQNWILLWTSDITLPPIPDFGFETSQRSQITVDCVWKLAVNRRVIVSFRFLWKSEVLRHAILQRCTKMTYV